MSEIAYYTDHRQAVAAMTQRIQAPQTRAVLAVNTELLGLYRDIGRQLYEWQRERAWGSAVAEQMTLDLQASYASTQLQLPTVQEIEDELTSLMHGDQSKPNE